MKKYFSFLLIITCLLAGCGNVVDEEEIVVKKKQTRPIYAEDSESETKEFDEQFYEEYLAGLQQEKEHLLAEFQAAVKNAQGIQTNLTQADVESDTIQWFNATYAPLTYANGEDLTLFGGEYPSEYSLAVQLLERDWGIYDRASADETIQSLLYEGHRTQYQLLVKAFEQEKVLYLTESEFETFLEENEMGEENYYVMLAAYRAYHLYEDKGIDAWDYCRVIQLMGNCYVCGYYSLPEALSGAYVIARHLQREYTSWEEMTGSYLKGYEFWAGDNPEDKTSRSFLRRNYFENLCKSDKNPYLLDWNLTLTDNWSKE